MSDSGFSFPRFSNIHLLVFDLDGTLVDTFADIAAAATYALQKQGRPAVDAVEVRPHVGAGGRNLMKGLLGEGASEVQINQAFVDWKEYYTAHPADFTHAYPSVLETLEELRQRRVKMAILSNKSHSLILAILEKLDMLSDFDFVQGEETGVPLKPNPAQLEKLMRQIGVSPGETMMVGDGVADMQVAHNAGVVAVGVDYGVCSRRQLQRLSAAVILEEITELLDQF